MRNCNLIYSMGTSTRAKEEFITLLQCHDVEIVIDVRRFPTSRIKHFKQQALKQLLVKIQIDYLHLGDKLGGYRDSGYHAFTATTEFKQGIETIERTASRRKSVILCAEKLPRRCHRRFITAELEKRGWQIKHMIDEKQPCLL